MEKITYRQLGRALATVGFEKVEGDNFTAFRNESYDAIIILPKGGGTRTVGSAHLLTARKTVTEKGITSPQKFTQMIEEAQAIRTSRIIRPRVAKEPTGAGGSVPVSAV